MSLIEKAVEKKKGEAQPDSKAEKKAAPAAEQVEKPAETVTASATSAPAPAPAPQSAPASPSTAATAKPAAEAAAPQPAEAPVKGAPEGPMIQIDLDHLTDEGLLSPKKSRSNLAEEFRVIKRGLLEKAMDPAGGRNNLIMVTSAAPREGKTQTAVNLAMSIAKEVDLYVMLIDADLSRPKVLDRLGIEKSKISGFLGLTDLLERPELDVRDVILKTNIPNFSLISSGKQHPLGTELLASQRAHTIIEEIAKRYRNRIIIFDTAPVLASSEGGALEPHVGQIVFVVEAERTKEEMVIEGLEMLDADEKIGLILNKVKTRFLIGGPSGYYGKYYYQYKS
ncbi:MAG: XrtA-associated tyrosine autokinase [Magnetospiraceae bacterium]